MLKFGTAGLPHGAKSYEQGFEILKKLGLDSMEVEFVHGVRMKKERAEKVGELAKDFGLTLTCHGPYYINLNAKEEEKREASKQRVINTVLAGKYLQAFSITFHAGFYLKMPEDKVYENIKKSLEEIMEELKYEVDIPQITIETTGKPTQFGELTEILRLTKDVEGIFVCIDFAHLHARSIGRYNSAKETEFVLKKVIQYCGEDALKRMHFHMAGIEYGQKGEKYHVNLRESDLRYEEILRVLKDYSVEGVLTCESPNLQEDACLLKETFLRML